MDSTGRSLMQWFVIRDLRRANSSRPAYRILADDGFEVFTPLKTVFRSKLGRKVSVQVPFIPDLLFVHSSRKELDPVIAAIPTLQYRFTKGGGYMCPMVVRHDDMQRFMLAVSNFPNPRFYAPEQISPAMIGSKIRIVSQGPANGLEGVLLKIRGSHKRRLLVAIPDFLLGAVEIADADYIEIKN